MEIMYRITEDWIEGDPCCREWVYKYEIIRKTKCGVWIRLNPFSDQKRFVNLSSFKKYAYPTLKEARQGYLHRKQAQVKILRSRLQAAEQALEMAKELVKEVECNGKQTKSSGDGSSWRDLRESTFTGVWLSAPT